MADGAGRCVAPLLNRDAEVFETRAIGIKTLTVGPKNGNELWREVQYLPKLRFLLLKSLFGDLAVVDIEVDPNPTYKCSIASSQRVSETEEPPVVALWTANPERYLARTAGPKTVGPDLTCFFVVIRMKQLNVGIPFTADIDPETKRVILRQSQVIRAH
jgi:hypothetical protein